MKEINPEGVSYIYFTRADGAPETNVMGMTVSRPVDPFMRQQLPTSNDFRVALVRWAFQRDKLLLYYLHWDNGSDLDALDRKIEEGTYSDADFWDSAKTEHKKTTCAGCHSTWDTLVMPPGDPYIGAPGLDLEKIRTHAIIERCPNCGALFRQLVVKIF